MPGKGDINPATGKAYAVNPATGNWDDNYWANTVEPQLKARYGVSSGAASAQNILDTAKQLQQFQVQQNQPAIATLSTQYNPATGSGSLVDRYNQVLQQITAGSQNASNQQTQITNAAMAQRGISNDSLLSQQNLQNSLVNVGAQYGGLLSQAGLSEQSQLGNIAAQIAQLQAGNVPQALNTSEGLAQIQNALQIAQTQAFAPQVLQSGQQLVNPATGEVIASGPQLNLGGGNTSGASATTSNGGNITNTQKAGGGLNPLNYVTGGGGIPSTPVNLSASLSAAGGGNSLSSGNSSNWLGSDIGAAWNWLFPTPNTNYKPLGAFGL